MPDHDVVIVGAGPVGVLLACLLSQQGRDVVVFERRSDADPRTRAIGIHPPGLAALDAAGIGASVRREALTLEGGEVRSRRRVLASLTFSADRPVLVLPQQRTAALLHSRLSQLSDRALLLSHTVRSVRQNEDLVRVLIEGPGGDREITAGLVVAADGVRSGVRDELGIRWRLRPGRASYAMADVDDPAGGSRAVLHCESGGLVESLPLPGGRRRWVVRQQTESLHADVTAEAFSAEIEMRTGMRAEIAETDGVTRFAASQHIAVGGVRGRVVLVGDAAHEISPIGGQGMNLGWRDAVLLAQELGAATRGRMPDLRRYEHRVSRSARRAQRRSAFYMSMGEPASGAALLGRESVIRLLGSRRLRGWTSGLITMRGL